MSSSTIRAATMLTGLPTEPIFRSASSPDSAQVTGDISVWPNTATLVTPGKASAIRVSRVVVAGAGFSCACRAMWLTQWFRRRASVSFMAHSYR
jgi:hypothetical protein